MRIKNRSPENTRINIPNPMVAFWVMIICSLVAWYLEKHTASLFSAEVFYTEDGYRNTVPNYMVP
jgi:hypothetical protein